MPKYKVKTDSGTYIIDADSPPPVGMSIKSLIASQENKSASDSKFTLPKSSAPSFTTGSEGSPIGSSAETLRAPTKKDLFREGMQYNIPIPGTKVDFNFSLPGLGSMTRDVVRSLGSIGGMAAGGMGSGPVGLAAGSALGGTLADRLIGQQLEKYAPGYFGQVEDQGEGLGAAFKQAGPEAALDLATLKAGKLASLLKNTRLKDMVKVSAERSAPELAAIARVKDPNLVDIAPNKFNTSVTFFAKEAREKEIHDALRSGAKTLTKEAREATIPKGKFAPLQKVAATSGERATEVSKAYHSTFNNIKREENLAWNEAISSAKETKITATTAPTSIDVDTGIINPKTGESEIIKQAVPGEPIEIAGPIYTKESSKVASKLLPEIDSIIDSLPDWIKSKKTQIVDSLTSISDPKLINGAPVNVEGLDKVKELMDDINHASIGLSKVSKEKGQMIELATALRKDIESSSNLWDKGSDSLNAAMNITKLRSEVLFPSEFRKAAELGWFAGKTSKLKPEIISKAVNNADFTKQMLNVTGDIGKGQIGAAYVDQNLRKVLFAGSTENMGSRLRGFLDQMDKPGDPAKILFTEKQQNSLRQLVRGMELTHDTRSLLFGSSVINWRRGYLAFGTAGAIASGAAGSALGSTAILGLTFAPIPIVKKYLFDPKFAKLVQRGVKVGADTAEDKWTNKQLMMSLRGTYGIMLADKGKQIPVKIGDNGKPKEVSKAEYDEWAQENE